jgi:H+/Cl- antiporter ClcA
VTGSTARRTTLPLTATAMVAATGDSYYGLWYPIVVSIMTVVVGAIFLRDNRDRDIHYD